MITETPQQDPAEGRPGSRFVRASSTSDWKRYHNPMISVANQANLDFDGAAPQLVGGLAYSIADAF